MTIPISAIRTDGGTQPRAALDPSTVGEYAQALGDGAVFPPVVVFYDGESHWLADGFHRLSAYNRLGCIDAPVEVRQGTRRDAVLFSVGANASHGLRRTNLDKRRAVETLLRDEEWAAWSDREIARRCAVDPKTVSAVRADLSVEFPQIDAERGELVPTLRTVERGGTTYTVTTDNIGRRAPERPQANRPKLRMPLTTAADRDVPPPPPVAPGTAANHFLIALRREVAAQVRISFPQLTAAQAGNLVTRFEERFTGVLRFYEIHHVEDASPD